MRHIAGLIAATLLLLSVSCAGRVRSETYPHAIDGVLDLRTWDFASNGPVPLTGTWEFYWNRLLEPTDFVDDTAPADMALAEVPGVWRDSVQGAQLPGRGFATYRLVVLVDGRQCDLAVRSLTVSTAFVLYVNGRITNRAGEPGRDTETSRPQYRPQVRHIEGCPSDRLELVLQVSNFDYRSGGLWRNFWIGSETGLSKIKWSIDMRTVLLFGTLIMMCVYHLALYLMRTTDRQFLFLALFCLFISMRPLFTGEYVITEIFPAIPFGLVIRVEYLSFYFAIIAATYFFRTLYPAEVGRWQPPLTFGVTAVFSAIVIFTPTHIFTRTVFLYYVVTFAVVLYVLTSNVIAVVRRRQGAVIVLVGALAIAAATVNDNLNARFLIHTGNLIDVAVVIFVLCQALVLSLRLTGTFAKVEALSDELTALNTGLERQVSERTSQLRSAYESIKALSLEDQLTGCYNRRFLDERLAVEIERASRYGRALSIIMCDIDNFKSINDAHGHQFGDSVLAVIGECIRHAVRDRADLACRYGGEEFAILLPEAEPKQAAILAERIRGNIERTSIPARTGAITVTASFGVSGFSRPSGQAPITVTELLQTADRMLYRAKEGGRNAVRVHRIP